MELEIAAGDEVGQRGAQDCVGGSETGYGCAGVDVGEGGGVEPVIFGVFDFEDAVWGDAGCFVSDMLRGLGKWNRAGERAYKSGWMGLRSIPVTMASGYSCALRC